MGAMGGHFGARVVIEAGMGNRHFFYTDSPCFMLAFVIVNGYNTGKGGCVCVAAHLHQGVSAFTK